jgi:agmatine/peptidylarginine deiminase
MEKKTEKLQLFLPAEWHPQGLVQLTWPHKDTDWAPMLNEVEACYYEVAREILKRQPLLIVSPYTEDVLRNELQRRGADTSRLVQARIPSNDTWARDHGMITLLGRRINDTFHEVGDDQPYSAILLDFKFNGWGMKFPANLDNQINAELMKQIPFRSKRVDLTYFVLEGGSIESDGHGTILTTTQCLTEPNRNGLTRERIEECLADCLWAKRVLWVNHGYLAGDDTDSHIDTLARFCPDNTIAYVQCLDPADEHYAALKAMEDDLKAFRTAHGKPYRLLPLPMPRPIHDEDGQRLPATYANFLIMNEAVLMPTYGQPDLDEQARGVLAQAFPDREIVGIDCRALIKQHGSLHCITMQFPQEAFHIEDLQSEAYNEQKNIRL